MNSKLSKKIGTGLMALLMTVCFIPAIAGAFAPGDGRQGKGFDRKIHHRSELGVWRDLQMVQDLGLTAEQVKEVRDADFAFREKRLALNTQLDSLRLQMDKAFSEDVVDDTTVLKTAQKISDVKGKLFILRIESRLELGKILNADQIKKLKLYAMQHKKQGPRQGQKN
jgi:Spy/CpxP family protein refolding chaperone